VTFKKTILIAIVLELVILISPLLIYGSSLEALQITTRYSGRLSLVIFSLIFFSQQKKIQWLSDKPYTIFTIVHGIHLIELISFVLLSHIILIPYRVLGGFIAYLLIFAMPFFHYRFMNNSISKKQFSIIENIFQLYVWTIFFITYLTRIMGKVPNVGGNRWEHIILLAWVLLLLIAARAPLFLSGKKIES
jgi:hypothetical protein